MTAKSEPSDDGTAPPAPTFPHPGLWEVFTAFLKIGLIGFGGLAPAATFVIVDSKKWYTPKEFVELFAICAIVPGGNILNAAIVIGHRFQGLAGAVAAIGALLLFPLTILITLAITYDSFSHIPDVRAATAGAASAAAGLIIGTAAKLIRGVEKSWTSLVFGLVTFAAVGLLHVPLQPALLVLIPVSILWAFYRQRAEKRR